VIDQFRVRRGWVSCELAGFVRDDCIARARVYFLSTLNSIAISPGFPPLSLATISSQLQPHNNIRLQLWHALCPSTRRTCNGLFFCGQRRLGHCSVGRVGGVISCSLPRTLSLCSSLRFLFVPWAPPRFLCSDESRAVGFS